MFVGAHRRNRLKPLFVPSFVVWTEAIDANREATAWRTEVRKLLDEIGGLGEAGQIFAWKTIKQIPVRFDPDFHAPAQQGNILGAADTFAHNAECAVDQALYAGLDLDNPGALQQGDLVASHVGL